MVRQKLYQALNANRSMVKSRLHEWDVADAMGVIDDLVVFNDEVKILILKDGRWVEDRNVAVRNACGRPIAS